MVPLSPILYFFVILLPLGLILAAWPGVLVAFSVQEWGLFAGWQWSAGAIAAVHLGGWLGSGLIVLLGTTTMRQLWFRTAVLSTVLACVLVLIGLIEGGFHLLVAEVAGLLAVAGAVVALVTWPRPRPQSKDPEAR